MKRLIPAAIILVFIVFLCVFSHTHVNRICDKTLSDVQKYYNQKISANDLEQSWKHNKEKLLLFVNHSFLDKISIYIGELTVLNDNKNNYFNDAYINIQTILSMIKEEQQFAAHSFY